MKNIFLVIIGFYILMPIATASDPDKCIDAWSESFNKVDAELMVTLEQLSKSNKKTSELAVAIPNIIRIYRRQLMLVCKAAEVKIDIEEIEQDSDEETKEKNTISLDETIVKLLEVGNEEVKISELENRYGSLKDCALVKTGVNYDLLKLWITCDMHADYKIKQLQFTLPSIMRKSSNRKQMGFLSFKLMDLQNRLEEFASESLNPFKNKLIKVLDSIKCVVKKCD